MEGPAVLYPIRVRVRGMFPTLIMLTVPGVNMLLYEQLPHYAHPHAQQRCAS
jgi:hypothetical protein